MDKAKAKQFNQQFATFKLREQLEEDGSITSAGEAYLPGLDVPEKKQNPFKKKSKKNEGDGYETVKGFRAGHTKDTGGFQYKDLWGLNETLTQADYQKAKTVLDKIKSTNQKIYDAIVNIIMDIDPHSLTSSDIQKYMRSVTPKDRDQLTTLGLAEDTEFTSIKENYSRFRNETKTRNKSDQFHQAVKAVKKRVQEINKLFEYVDRLKTELSEGSEGFKYKKYTENAIQQIKEFAKELYTKSKKLK